jgi:hypothetical protein
VLKKKRGLSCVCLLLMFVVGGVVGGAVECFLWPGDGGGIKFDDDFRDHRILLFFFFFLFFIFLLLLLARVCRDSVCV